MMQGCKLTPVHVVNWEDTQEADMVLAACRKWLKACKDTPTKKRDALLKKYLGQSGRHRGGPHSLLHMQQLGPE